MDSDDENDRDDGSINMTGFMFGNIDKNGELEDDILDSEAKQHLASLSHFGISSLLQEMLKDDVETKKSLDDDSETKDEKNNDKDNIVTSDKDDDDDDDDYQEKSPTAFDFSDINELAEDNCEDNTSMFFFGSIDYIDIILLVVYIISIPISFFYNKIF